MPAEMTAAELEPLTKQVIERLLASDPTMTRVRIAKMYGVSRTWVWKVEKFGAGESPIGRPKADLKNERFGKLVCQSQAKVIGANVWKCKCNCGRNVMFTLHALRSGEFPLECGECGQTS